METKDKVTLTVGIIGAALGIANFSWLLVKHFRETRVRLVWHVTVGQSIDDPPNHLHFDILLVNRGRAVLLDNVRVTALLPPPSPAGVPCVPLSAEKYAELDEAGARRIKAMGYGGLEELPEPGFGDGHAIKIDPHDSYHLKIPVHNDFFNNVRGIKITLRDGRSTLIPIDEIIPARLPKRRRRSGWLKRLE